MAFVIHIIVGEFYTIEANHLSHPVLSGTWRVRVDIQMRGDTWMICVSSHHPLRAVVYIPKTGDNNNNFSLSIAPSHQYMIKSFEASVCNFTIQDSPYRIHQSFTFLIIFIYVILTFMFFLINQFRLKDRPQYTCISLSPQAWCPWQWSIAGRDPDCAPWLGQRGTFSWVDDRYTINTEITLPQLFG